MTKRTRRFVRRSAAGGMLLQFAGCVPRLNEDVNVFLGDLAREMLAAFLF